MSKSFSAEKQISKELLETVVSEIQKKEGAKGENFSKLGDCFPALFQDSQDILSPV